VLLLGQLPEVQPPNHQPRHQLAKKNTESGLTGQNVTQKVVANINVETACKRLAKRRTSIRSKHAQRINIQILQNVKNALIVLVMNFATKTKNGAAGLNTLTI
jgi:hypothetical protein